MTMDYERFLSGHALALRESAIRKMGALMAQATDLVSFAPGYPDESLLPWEALRGIADDLLSGKDGKVLQYGATRGYRPLIESIVSLMRARGIERTADGVIVTTGSQQGLDLVARVLCDPGDVLLVELPSYVGAISAFRNLGIDLVGVPQESDGLDLDALDRTLRRLRADGRRVRALYTVPNFQNPTGLLVSQVKRRALLDWAAAADLLVVEDDPYRELYFEDVTSEADTQPIAAHDAVGDGRVIYLSSFSKTLAPAFRTAWISAPPPIAARMELAKQSIDLCTGGFDQRVVDAACRSGLLAAQLPKLRAAYQAKRDVMAGALSAELPGMLEWTAPRGGFFLWARLPHGVDATRLLEAAHRRGVIYVTGDAFFVNGAGQDFVRLAFSAPTHARIEEGVRRLALAIRELSAAELASAPDREAPTPAPR